MPSALTDTIPNAAAIQTAEIVLPCADLDTTLRFFTEALGFRVAAIYPADAPAVASVVGHGLRLRLDSGYTGAPGRLRLLCDATVAVGALPSHCVAPNGTRIEFVDADPPVHLPELQPERVVTRAAQGAWHLGRAGLSYRDLIPGRLGGRFLASHIRLSEGGPVDDYVHFHKVRFQMIYCHRGWVRVVYEDQGEPFLMHEGDCVLQPPGIRHRVLESSAGMEVIEVGCPALHETLADADMALPNDRVNPGRAFEGQRFVRHVAAAGSWQAWHTPGFKARDLGIAEGTQGLAGARVVRRAGEAAPLRLEQHDAEFHFVFVCDGAITLLSDDAVRLQAGDACTVPAGLPHVWADATDDLCLLEVSLPGQLSHAPFG